MADLPADIPADIQYLERECSKYEEALACGALQSRTPLDICRTWQQFLRRNDVSASEAAELVRRSDAAQHSFGGVAFFGMCNTIREWYQRLYQCELDSTFNRKA